MHAGCGRPPHDATGFTVTELVVVLALIGIIAGIAGPRFFGVSEFDERFFHDEVRNAVAYARKLAIASGCEVQVALNAGGYELRQRQTCDAGPFTAPVFHPASGALGYSGTPPPGVPLASTVTPLVFDGLGRARDGGGNVVDFTVTVGPRSFGGVGETGYVRAP